jgi:hypothetical protein
MKQNSERLKKIKEEVDRANELNDQLKDYIQLMKEISHGGKRLPLVTI